MNGCSVASRLKNVCEKKNKEPHKSGYYTGTRPVCTQDSIHNCITNPIVDGLSISTADEELVLRAKRRQMVARHEARAKTG